MANVQISALPSTSSTTLNDWVIKNDSGETLTSKVKVKDMIGMSSYNGSDSIQSSKWLTSLGTTASTIGSIAIGAGAEATSPYSIAIGYEALNSNRDGTRDYYTCIGYRTRAVQGGTAFGKEAAALGANATAIGQSAQSFGNGGFSVGNSALNQGTNGLALGSSASDQSNNDGVAIGYLSSVSNGDYGVAIGSNATTQGNKSVSMGYFAKAMTGSTVAIGDEAEVTSTATYGIAIGSISDVTAQFGIAIGRDADVTADYGIAIGGETDVTAPTGIAIGQQADSTADQAVAIGYLAVADQQNSVALGSSINTDFANTTKTRSVQSTGQFFNAVQQLGSGTTFNINWNDGGSIEFTLTGNGTCTMSNVRDGAIYRVKVTTTGNYIFTPSASGYTFIYQGGGFNLTNNGTDLCILHVFGTVVMVTHFANFS